MTNQVVSNNYVAACVKSLEEYDLGEPLVINSRAFALMGDDVEAPAKGSIVGEGLIAFSANLSGVNRTDAQNAYLYASLVANKRYPLDSQGVEWYTLFREVMTNAGWAPTSKYFSDM
jgi:hypothetical protein